MMHRSWVLGVGLFLQALFSAPLLAQQAAGVVSAAPAVVSAPAPTSSVPASAPAPAVAEGVVNVVLHTALGDVVVAVDQAHAPVTARNFLRYVDEKRFDGVTFYRALKVTEDGQYGLVQGGAQGDPKRVLPPIAHEAPKDTGLHNVEGAVAMARAAPGTADADFFIDVGDLSSLDGGAGGDPGYAVFGKVVSGMDVVKSMLELPRSTQAANPAMQGQMLANPVKIISVRRED